MGEGSAILSCPGAVGVLEAAVRSHSVWLPSRAWMVATPRCFVRVADVCSGDLPTSVGPHPPLDIDADVSFWEQTSSSFTEYISQFRLTACHIVIPRGETAASLTRGLSLPGGRHHKGSSTSQREVAGVLPLELRPGPRAVSYPAVPALQPWRLGGKRATAAALPLGRSEGLGRQVIF